MTDRRRCLVTGGAGFIGSHLVATLLARGDDVVVLDDLSSGKRENLDAAAADAVEATFSAATRERLEFVDGSLLDEAALAAAIDGVDAVLHQAAIPTVPRSFADPASTLRANVEGTARLLEACRRSGIRRIVMASSSSVYGDTPTLPKHESMPPAPLSPYALSKLAGEQAGSIFVRTYALEVYALRYFNVFGPRQDPNSEYAAVVPRFITRMLAGEPPVIFGDGFQSRDFTFVSDVVAANLAALDAPPGACFHALNIGANGRHTLLELVAILREILGVELAPEHTDPRPGDVRDSYAAIDKAREVLGYAPAVSFEEGLQRTAAEEISRQRGRLKAYSSSS